MFLKILKKDLSANSPNWNFWCLDFIDLLFPLSLFFIFIYPTMVGYPDYAFEAFAFYCIFVFGFWALESIPGNCS